MMSLLLFIFFIPSLLASAPGKWDLARSIVDKHEFYGNDEVIVKPKDSWQFLFAVTFLDENYNSSKDCVFYRVPGESSGTLKIKTLPIDVDCHNEILAPGDYEVSPVSDLRLSENGSGVRLSFKLQQKIQRWEVQPAKKWDRPEAKLLLSSSDYKSPRMIYLAPAPVKSSRPEGLSDKTICHEITSDCLSRGISTCHLCQNGWYEVPNGCESGPKFCGVSDCGQKDRPACRRGFVWNQLSPPLDCRVNSEFAWCSGNLKVVCEGDKAFCR